MESRRAWTTVIVGTLTMTVSYVDRQTLAVLAPHVTHALHMTDAEYGLLGSAFALAYLVATPISGWWLDRIGARRGLVRSLLAWSTVAALHAVVPGFATLLCFRIALGLAEGPGFPGGAQTVQRMLPDRDQPRGFGILFIGSSLGGMITPPLASWLFRVFDWRTAFLGSAIVGLAWIPLWLFVTRHDDVRERLDRSDSAPRMRLGELVADPIIIRAIVAVIASSPIVLFVEQWSSKFLVGELAVQQGDVGHYLWLPPLWFDVGALAFGHMAAITRRGFAPPRMLYAFATALGCCLALMPLAASSGSPWRAIAVMCIAQVGSGALRTLVTADLLVRIPRHSIAFAGGVLACGQSIAYFVAGPLIGYAHDHHVAYPTIAVAIAAWLVPGSLAWIAWRPADQLERKVL